MLGTGRRNDWTRPGALLAGTLLLTLLLSAPGATQASPLSISYDIHALTDNATRQPDGSWLVPVGERVEWQVVWSVANTSSLPVESLGLRNHYSSEIEVDPRSISGSMGDADVFRTGGANSSTTVLWSIGDLPAASSATLTFRIATGTNPQGKQLYGDPGDYCLDSALTIKWRGGSTSFDCVAVHAQEFAWMRLELPATRKDWRVRKPGDYTSLALQVRISSNSSVIVQFQDFGDLTSQGPVPEGSSSAIATWYAAGDTLGEASAAGWWPSGQLNDQAFTFASSETLRQGVDWFLWERLDVGPEHAPGEYQSEGVVRFVLANAAVLVVGGETP
ncbi:hypothetical protein [Limnochorda pilosa]|uniref:DUF11 domain-containing protein n=1 Tax=Limnochorda pilosa TaxID=1555112 RepID=A0A0K2SNL0_LIMPI|nr:hypothetical protein [Limnochorda pilosa]BAS28681.1 hypothetical protein LIP_2852 [Limnochorda pilosa]